MKLKIEKREWTNQVINFLCGKCGKILDMWSKSDGEDEWMPDQISGEDHNPEEKYCPYCGIEIEWPDVNIKDGEIRNETK